MVGWTEKRQQEEKSKRIRQKWEKIDKNRSSRPIRLRKKLTGLSLDDGLDRLVDVVVFVFVDMRTEMSSGSLSVGDGLGILDGGSLLVQFRLVLREHVLLVFSDNGGSSRLDMLGSKGLVVLDRLDSVLECKCGSKWRGWNRCLTWWWWTCFSRSTASAVSTCSWFRIVSWVTSGATSEQT